MRVLAVVSVTTVANGKIQVTLVKGNAAPKVSTCVSSRLGNKHILSNWTLHHLCNVAEASVVTPSPSTSLL